MRILFISIPFYEYINKIREEIVNITGAEVDCLIVDKRSKGFGYVANKISRGKFDLRKDTVNQKAFFHKNRNTEYDIVFVLVGRGLNFDIFEDFLKSQEKAKKILYVWDDIARIQNFEKLSPLFDRVISFDLLESGEYGFEYLPDFFCEDYTYRGEEKTIDISMIGSLHSDRIEVLSRMQSVLPEKSYKWFVKLMTTRAHAILREDWKNNHGIFSYSEMPISENAAIMKRSKATLDVQHPSQKGVSMRTIECLAAHTKLITTNESVKRYDFYNPDNILVIDRNNPVVDLKFLEVPFNTGAEDVLAKYSLNNWVKTIFRI